MLRVHRFDRVCREHGIQHRLTKPNHPWANGQVEQMSRTLEGATVRRSCHPSHDQPRGHLQRFVDAYDHARRRETRRDPTPHELIRQARTSGPERFGPDPSHHIPGPYS